MKNEQIALLAGGVGGAKLVYGFSRIASYTASCVIVNTGDDFTYYGLKISPDIDSVLYALADISHKVNGYGRNDDTYSVFDTLSELGEQPWFRIGDKDLALSLVRTEKLNSGVPLSQCNCEIAKSLGVTFYGIVDFQEYFVKLQFKPKIKQVIYSNIENAKLSQQARAALEKSSIVVICPSNPWLSIFPILSIEGVKDLLRNKKVIAVSPIIGENATKGPTAKIFKELGITPSALEVARLYKDLINQIVIDHKNVSEKIAIEELGIKTTVTDIIMNSKEDKIRLAKEILSQMDE